MYRHRKKEKDSYGVVGLGRFGHAFAMELVDSGQDILVIDRDEEKVRELREYTENAFVVKTLDKKTLSETGIQNCDVAVVCIGEQIDTSILTTLHLVSMGIPRVIAKAASHEHGEILEKLGAEVVYPERDMAIRLVRRLETTSMLDFVQLSERVNIIKMVTPGRIIGKTVKEVNLRRTFGLNIIAIENTGTITEVVDPDYVFQKGDILFLAGGKAGMSRLSDWAENE